MVDGRGVASIISNGDQRGQIEPKLRYYLGRRGGRERERERGRTLLAT